jgi:penicillin-binding protein 1B
MRLWAGLFRNLPLKAVDLRMPDGANFVWVDKEQQALTGPSCPGAVQIPFIEGTEPEPSTRCLEKLDRGSKKSLWRKWFDGKD